MNLTCIFSTPPKVDFSAFYLSLFSKDYLTSRNSHCIVNELHQSIPAPHYTEDVAATLRQREVHQVHRFRSLVLVGYGGTAHVRHIAV